MHSNICWVLAEEFYAEETDVRKLTTFARNSATFERRKRRGREKNREGRAAQRNTVADIVKRHRAKATPIA
jgi:hypothetical protein